VGLVTTGAGSWIAVPRAPRRSTSAFNKLSTTTYLSAAGFDGFVSLPLLWTAVLPSRSTTDAAEPARHRLAPGHLSFYVGRKIGIIEPRLGLKVPLYTIGQEPVWIGSRNTRLVVGAGINSKVREADGLTLSGELMWDIYLNRWPDSYATPHHPDNALDRSWELAPRFKVSYRFNETWKSGLEILSTVKHVFYDAWLPEGVYELGVNVTPNLFGELYISPEVALTAKAGFGWSFSGLGPEKKTDEQYDYLSEWIMEPAFEHRGYAVNLSVGLNWYP
jgi:hypothetical protein